MLPVVIISAPIAAPVISILWSTNPVKHLVKSGELVQPIIAIECNSNLAANNLTLDMNLNINYVITTGKFGYLNEGISD